MIARRLDEVLFARADWPGAQTRVVGWQGDLIVRIDYEKSIRKSPRTCFGITFVIYAGSECAQCFFFFFGNNLSRNYHETRDKVTVVFALRLGIPLRVEGLIGDLRSSDIGSSYGHEIMTGRLRLLIDRMEGDRQAGGVTNHVV